MAFAGGGHLAVLLGAVASWLFGALWYGLLGQAWMRALGKTKADLVGPSGRPSPMPFVIAFVAELLMAWTLAGLLFHMGPVTMRRALITAALIWLGFVLTTMLVNNTYARANPRLTAIDGGHWLGVLLVQALVIGALGAG